MDIGGNIFYHLKNADISGKSLDGFMKSVKNSDAEEMVFRLDEKPVLSCLCSNWI